MGGAYGGTLYNCTVAGNGAGTTQGTGAGVFGSTLYNCIVWFNTWGEYDDTSTLNYCFIGDPLFVDYARGNLRLQFNSPCINAGNNAYVMTTTDADGNPQTAAETYMALLSQKDVRMIQTSGGVPGLLTLSQ